MCVSGQTNLTDYEYWFNNDFGQRQAVSVVPAPTHLLTAGFDVNTLPDGVNMLNIRYKDENGRYSSTLSKVFYKNTEVLALNNRLEAFEYWLNGDYGNKQVVPVSPTAQHELITTVDMSALPDGVNILHMRYRDERGVYSSTLSKVFYKNTEVATEGNTLQAYEYWFNDDFGNKQVVAVNAAAGYNLIADIDASTLMYGVNVLNIRFRDESGKYSSTLSRMFFKMSVGQITDNHIAGYRYWYDDDIEGSVWVELLTPAPQADVIANVDMTKIPKGEHTVHFQFKDVRGAWSVVVTDTIEKLGLPVADFSYTATSYCDSTVVDFADKSVDGEDYYWDFGDGTNSVEASPSHTYRSTGTFTVSQTVTDPLTLADSTVEAQVVITGNTRKEITETACGSYLSPSGNYAFTESGTYQDTIPNSSGCDSILTIYLTVLQPATGTDEVTACGAYTWIDGITYTESNNTATYAIPGGAGSGCDSIVTLNLTIATVDNSVSQDGIVLTANAPGATYQWLDCENGQAPISGATSQSFTAPGNGSYAVRVVQNNCADTSACLTVSITGFVENNFETEIQLYPNPTSGQIAIDLGRSYPETQVHVLDLEGRIVLQQVYRDQKTLHIDIHAPQGIYLVTIDSEEYKAVLKVVKQ
jgi:PKD repeat protein